MYYCTGYLWLENIAHARQWFVKIVLFRFPPPVLLSFASDIAKKTTKPETVAIDIEDDTEYCYTIPTSNLFSLLGN